MRSAIEKLERGWSSSLSWHAQPWLSIEPHATQIFISLSKLRAYTVQCDPRSEPAVRGAGRYLRGTLTVRTDDGLLQLSAPVRIDHGPPGAVRLELDRSQAPWTKADPKRVQRIVLSVFPDRAAPGSLNL